MRLYKLQIKKAPKLCQYPGCKYPAFSKGYCKNPSHQNCRTDAQFLRAKAKRAEKAKQPRKRIKPLSDKRAEQYKQYYAQREVWLAKPENNRCAMYPWLEATTVHHMGGKIELDLLDESKWVGLSLLAHMWVEEHPNLAKEYGLSLERLS